MLDLTPASLETVRTVLSRNIPDREVWAFGSRVTGTAKSYSDLDLAILGETAMPARIHNQLIEAFQESDLPVRVDIVEWSALVPAFRERIRQNHLVIQTGDDQGTI